MAAADEPRGANVKLSREKRRKRPVKPPAGDIAASGGNYGLPEAKKAERSKPIRAAQRAAYEAAPVEQRQRILKHATGPVAEVAQTTHDARVDRARALLKAQAQHDVPTDTDLSTASRYLAAHPTILKHKQTEADLYLTDPEQLKRAGFKQAGALDKAIALPATIIPAAARRGKNIAQATIEDPFGVAGNTARSLPSIAAGTVGFAGDLVAHPARTVRELPGQISKDYARRYGASDREQIEQIKREGVAPDIADAAAVGGGVGAIAGRSLGKVAREGGLGKSLQQTATTRPALRVRAGEGGTVERTPSRNLIVAVGQGKVDQRRARKIDRRLLEATDTTVPASERPRVRGLVPEGPGEVVARRGAQNRAMRKDVAGRQARAQTQLRRGQERELNKGTRRNLRQLSKPERAAFKYAVQLGLPADPAKATRILKEHRANIVAAREATGTVPARTDELLDLDRIIAAPGKHLTPRLRQIADIERDRASRTAQVDPAITADIAHGRSLHDQVQFLLASQKRARDAGQPVRDKLPLRRVDPEGKLESLQDYVRRVTPQRIQQVAHAAGLEDPGYFHSRERPVGVASAFTPGRGGRAVAGPKRNEGALFATGRQDANPDAFVTGLARNLKRGVNWNLVADTWEAHSPEWGRRKTVSALRRELDARGLDERDWRIVDFGKYRQLRENAPDPDRGDDIALTGSKDIHDALRKSTHTLAGAEAEFKDTNRLSLVPRAVADELEAGLRPSEARRVFQKLQGVQSKLLLNLNPTFVPVQVVAQTPLAIFATRGKVHDLIGGQVWYRGLDRASKDVVDDFLGISVSRSHGETPRFGAAADSRFARFFEATVDNPKVQALQRSPANFMQWNPWLDDKQNNFFRRAVFYNEAKRQARDRIGVSARALSHEVQPIIDIFNMPDGPEKIAALRAAEPRIERAAEHVNEMLGDYTRYTARERGVLKTALLFYGFLRWSVQFAFYTLPVKHPIAASIAAKLGQLHNEEVIDLLADQYAKEGGTASRDEVAKVLRHELPYAFGRVYFTGGDKVQSIDLARVSPVSNPLMEALATPAGAITGLVSPVLQAAQAAVFGRNSFGQTINVKGIKTAPGETPDLDVGTSGRVFAGSLARSTFPGRFGENILHPEEQGADAIPLISERPINVSSPQARARQQEKLEGKGSKSDRARQMLMPLVSPRNDTTAAAIAYRLAVAAAREKRRHKVAPTIVRDQPSSGANGPVVKLPTVKVPQVKLPQVKVR